MPFLTVLSVSRDMLLNSVSAQIILDAQKYCHSHAKGRAFGFQQCTGTQGLHYGDSDFGSFRVTGGVDDEHEHINHSAYHSFQGNVSGVRVHANDRSHFYLQLLRIFQNRFLMCAIESFNRVTVRTEILTSSPFRT